MTSPIDFCPNCDMKATIVREKRLVSLGSRRIEIDDEFLRCNTCAEEFYTPELADQRQARAVRAARIQDNLLTPNQIKAAREGLNLTQRVFEQILGVGEKTCIRWEQGRVCQNAATDRLIRLIMADRQNIQRLAAINGVLLPDSCFVPDSQTRAANELAARNAWFDFPIEIGQTTVVSGNRELRIRDTAEHKAIIAAATEQLETQPISTTGLFGPTSQRREIQ